jgi:hypothetical protein
MRSGPVARDEELQRKNTREKSYQESLATSRSRASNYWREATARYPHATFPSSAAEAAGERVLERGYWRKGLGCAAKKVGPATHFLFFTGEAARWRWP